jgi:tricarballylate dehydrogenase
MVGLDGEKLTATVGAYNAAVRDGLYDPTLLDGCATDGLTPPKSHWALRIDTPPFYAYPLGTGVTFTYLGVGIDETGRVRHTDGGTFDNVFAAGEIMAGNVLREGYLAGFGMTVGTVFGRLAGEQAACAAGFAGSGSGSRSIPLVRSGD